jgi:hypothetical protein
VSVLYRTDSINVVDSTAYEQLLGTLSGKIDRTRSDVKKIAGRISGGSAISPGSSPSPAPVGEYSNIPLHPHPDDYPKVKHWTSDRFTKLRHTKRENIPEDLEDPVNAQFYEEPSGKIIPLFRRLRIRGDAKAILQGMLDRGVQLKPVTDVAWEPRQEFRDHMERLHPWLRLCHDSWKADRIWAEVYQDPSKEGKKSKRSKRERSVEEGEPGPSSKKLKTPDAEEPETLAPKKPTRPKPTLTKPVAKVLKCSPFVSTNLLKHV